MSELALIFEGTDIEAEILKGQLASADIQALLKSEPKSAVIAGFGSLGPCGVYILHSDAEKAAEIVQNFKSRNTA